MIIFWDNFKKSAQILKSHFS